MMEGERRNYDSWLDVSKEDGLSRFLRDDSELRSTQSVQHELSSRVTFRSSSNSTLNRAFNFGRSQSASESLEIDEEISHVETIEQVLKQLKIHSNPRHCDSCTCKSQSEIQQQPNTGALTHQMCSSIKTPRECNPMNKNERQNSKVEFKSDEEKIEDFLPSFYSTPVTEEIEEAEFDTTFIAEVSRRNDKVKKCLNSEFTTCLNGNETPKLLYQSSRSRRSEDTCESIGEKRLGLYSSSDGIVTTNKHDEGGKDDVIQKEICTMITPSERKNNSNRPGIKISLRSLSVPRSGCHPPSQTPNSHLSSDQSSSSRNDNITRSSAGPRMKVEFKFEFEQNVQWN